MVRKTKEMLRVEREHNNRPIQDILIEALRNYPTVTEAADALGVSKATLGYWRLKLRIEKNTSYSFQESGHV